MEESEQQSDEQVSPEQEGEESRQGEESPFVGDESQEEGGEEEAS